jgi:hypothetical protein
MIAKSFLAVSNKMKKKTRGGKEEMAGPDACSAPLISVDTGSCQKQ